MAETPITIYDFSSDEWRGIKESLANQRNASNLINKADLAAEIFSVRTSLSAKPTFENVSIVSGALSFTRIDRDWETRI